MDNNSNFNLLNSNNLRGIRSRNSRNIQGNISFSYDDNASNFPINGEIRPNQVEIGERTFADLEALTKVINAMDKTKQKGTKYSMQINLKG